MNESISLISLVIEASIVVKLVMAILLFFFNDTATTEIYTLSLHDALPIYLVLTKTLMGVHDFLNFRSEERFSRNAETDLLEVSRMPSSA